MIVSINCDTILILTHSEDTEDGILYRLIFPRNISVSYTHLDVYKRQTVETAQAAQELPGGVWMLDTWKVDGATATFSLVDEMERLNKSTYETAAFDGQAHTLYALARDVLNDAGLPPERYYIDPALNDTSTPCPLPLVSHAAALQLIAGAGRARLYVSRQGVVTLERLIGKAAPKALSGTAQMPWSEAHTVLDLSLIHI